MPDDSGQTIVDEFARLPVHSFVDVLQRVFDARQHELRLRHFDTRYVLAVNSTYRPDGGGPESGHVEVEFVARPFGEAVEDGLAQSGTCPRCHMEVTSTSKLARCAICGAEVGLT